MWENGTSKLVPMEEFLSVNPAAMTMSSDPGGRDQTSCRPVEGGVVVGVEGVEEEEEEDADMRMASAVATAMVAGKLGASTGDEINFVHSLMDQFLRTSVVEEERENDGRDTDLSKRQEEDEVSQLPSDLPGAMLSSSDEEEINSSRAFTTDPSDLPAVTDPYILHLLHEAERKQAADGADATSDGFNAHLQEQVAVDDDDDVWVAQHQHQHQHQPKRRSSLLMSKMRSSFDELHDDLWATTMAEESSGVSATPDRTISTAWGTGGGGGGGTPLPTSPLSSTTRSEMSTLSDSDRVPLDRIARIMRGGANGLQNSFTSSITSSTGCWSSDDEEEEDVGAGIGSELMNDRV